ncbi:MAG: flagellar basal body rod protein FlgB [Candidatus Hydrogenedentota bacterium]|jgi:flagellar basal-body rod protein FlgB
MSVFSGVSTVDLLASAMGVAQDNHRIIANNIANADTPGYTPVKLDFQGTLRSAIGGRGRISLRSTRPQHLQREFGTPRTHRFRSTSTNDGNKVELEMEIAALSKNTRKYSLYASILAKQFQMTKYMLTNTR